MKNETFRAYKDACPELETVMRLQSVKRWHMIDTTRQQTLAEHTANVAILAWHISGTAPAMYFGPSSEIATYALMHDVGEVFMGDIPTHTKRSSAEMFEACKKIELSVTPPSMSIKVPERIRYLIKACDLADGIRFIRLHGVGVTARHAESGLVAQQEQVFRSMKQVGIPEDVVAHVLAKCSKYVEDARG